MTNPNFFKFKISIDDSHWEESQYEEAKSIQPRHKEQRSEIQSNFEMKIQIPIEEKKPKPPKPKPKPPKPAAELTPPPQAPPKSNWWLNTAESQLNQVLLQIIEQMITFDSTNGNYGWFVYPVKSKDVKNYYTVIKKPICLEDMKNKAKKLEYLNIETFKQDVELMFQNSSVFNGQQSLYTKQAERIKEFA